MSRTVYDYTGRAGDYLFSVVVERADGEPKRVAQGVRQPDGSFTWGFNGISERPLYRLPELVAHLAAGRPEPVYIVEGERDVETLRLRGLVATTNPMGAGKWHEDHTETLTGARYVVIVADRDGPGRAHARHVYGVLHAVVDRVEVAEPPADLGQGADVSDLFAAGRGLDALVPLAIEADERPQPEPMQTAPPHSWRPVPILEAATEGPSVTPDYGRGLVYGRGATLVSGEPGVGKSLFLAAVLADEARAGRPVLYLDFERTPELLLDRLQSAALSAADLDRVHYLRPRSPSPGDAIATMVEDLHPALVAIDSYDAALALFGLEAKNEDVRVFDAAVIQPLRSVGASVVLADHVTKDRERRGRYSIGGQAKLALAEAHLGLVALAPLRRGAEGRLRVRPLKDTYGLLPPAAIFTLRSHEATGALSWDVRAEEAEPGADTFRPTGLMKRVSRALEISGEPVSRAELERTVKGKREYVRLAVDALVREGHAEETAGARGARLVALQRPYREADDE